MIYLMSIIDVLLGLYFIMKEINHGMEYGIACGTLLILVGFIMANPNR